jgi:hypothetical protein
MHLYVKGLPYSNSGCTSNNQIIPKDEEAV